MIRDTGHPRVCAGDPYLWNDAPTTPCASTRVLYWGMAADEYHEAILERIHALQREIATLSQREALSYAYLISREITEDAARILIAEMLMEYWARAHSVGTGIGQ